MAYKGIRNHYRPEMPFLEKILKDLGGFVKDSLTMAKKGGKLPVLVVYPDYPSKKTTIYKIASKLGFRLTNLPLTKAEIVLFFENKTDKASYNDPVLDQYKQVLNRQCQDISKKKVDSVHQEVFGYCTIIDPLTHKGIAVEKSDENAMHDGQIVHCPVSTKNEDRVYQVLIDNRFDEISVVDMRVPVIGKSIPLVYQKFKTNELRFTNDVFKSTLHTPDELLSPEELKFIIDFAQKMQVDFAELDVLRDNSSGKIYAIDVNTTPYGPPKGLSKAEDEMAVELLCNAFQAEFISRV